MAAPLSLYEIFDNPDHRTLIRAYPLENLLVNRLTYDDMRILHIEAIPPQPITWNFLPFIQDDAVIIYGGYCDFTANNIPLNMVVWGVGLAYENLDDGIFISLGFQHFRPTINFVSLQQRLRATIAYTVISQMEE